MTLDEDDWEAYLAEQAAKKESNLFEIWPENLEAVRVFCQCMTQWRVVGGGFAPPIWMGLDYAAVDAMIRHAGHRGKKARLIFADILTMEAAALEEIKRLRPRNA